VKARDPDPVADGVWIVRGGVPKVMNVYLIADAGGGVTVYDAGIRAMAGAVAAAAAQLGGINRVVLGHSHEDHRGGAPELGAPVYCHPAERAYAERPAPPDYADRARLGIPARWVLPRLLARWDGGPVEIAGTVEAGDEVSGFRVVHLPGHTPGLIALHRERDRLALVSDAFYTLDVETNRKGEPRVPHPFYTQDGEQARASLRKLAGLDVAAAWAGHADPVLGDVRGQLERAAAA
jgi:glyoxylase-like metal-dependent hydrolase (beta-lactamase superfamily II)